MNQTRFISVLLGAVLFATPLLASAQYYYPQNYSMPMQQQLYYPQVGYGMGYSVPFASVGYSMPMNMYGNNYYGNYGNNNYMMMNYNPYQAMGYSNYNYFYNNNYRPMNYYPMMNYSYRQMQMPYRYGW